MALSNNLISQFVKSTKDTTKPKKETYVYGTIQDNGGSKSVKIDGSDMAVPIYDQVDPVDGKSRSSNTTVDVEAGDRVTVLIKNNTATVTGNLSDKASRFAQVNDLDTQVTAVIQELKAYSIDVVKADIETLKANDVTITGRLNANEGNFNTLSTRVGEIDELVSKKATIEQLNAVTADIEGKITAGDAEIEGKLTAEVAAINDLITKKATIESLDAVNAAITSLQTDKLDAESANLQYAKIDFSNISTATIESLYATSGLIENVTISEGRITGRLSGVTIDGDLIEANTLVANKLVVLGEDGLYYRLNTNGVGVTGTQTDYNSLNGSVIKAKSIVAGQISVTDLEAFGATIGGFKIGQKTINSVNKTTVDSTADGIYMDSDGLFAFGNDRNYVKYYKDTDGVSHIQIAADEIVFGSQSTNLATAIENASKTATNYMSLSSANGLIVGDFTGSSLLGNIQMKAETGGSSISLRHGNTILTKFMATNKSFTGITNATTSTVNGSDDLDDETGNTTTENVVEASQTFTVDQTLSVVQFESTNPIYFTQGIRTAGVTINDNSMISNVDFTLNGRIFDRSGRSAFEPITSEGNLSIGYGRYKKATTSSTDFSTLYGNKVRLVSKNGAFIYQNGSAALETLNSNGNATFGHHLRKKGSGNTNIYAGDGVNLIGKSTFIQDSTGNAAFESRNNSGNTTLGYARYANSGLTNIYGGTELNFITKAGGTIRAHNALVPDTNGTLALGQSGSLGWSNIYLGNASNAYNGLRIIVSGTNYNLCGRDEEGRTIFGHADAIMHYRVKDVSSTATGNAFRFTSGNDGAANNTSSIWLFGAADSTSRYIGSYVTYARTYTSAANMHITGNGVFGRSASSSERYKTDITETDIADFRALYDLPVKKYKYIPGYICQEDERCNDYLYGFIVEDMVDILPCAVQCIEDENGDRVPEMWNSNVVIPALLKLIQDLNNRVRTLEEATDKHVVSANVLRIN